MHKLVAIFGFLPSTCASAKDVLIFENVRTSKYRIFLYHQQRINQRCCGTKYWFFRVLEYVEFKKCIGLLSESFFWILIFGISNSIIWIQTDFCSIRKIVVWSIHHIHGFYSDQVFASTFMGDQVLVQLFHCFHFRTLVHMRILVLIVWMRKQMYCTTAKS